MVKWCQHTFDKQKHCCNTRTQLSQRIVLVLHTLSKLHTATGLKAISATKMETLHGAVMSTYLQDRHHCKMKSEVEHKVKHGASAGVWWSEVKWSAKDFAKQECQSAPNRLGHMSRIAAATVERRNKWSWQTVCWSHLSLAARPVKNHCITKKVFEENAHTRDWETHAVVSSTATTRV